VGLDHDQLDRLEHQLVATVLGRADGDVELAAALLGITPPDLLRLKARLGVAKASDGDRPTEPLTLA
jgi:transcriptional regulator with GAF, ATPase, and Fis domain